MEFPFVNQMKKGNEIQLLMESSKNKMNPKFIEETNQILGMMMFLELFFI